MKKIFAITLAVALCFCVSASALAAGDSMGAVDLTDIQQRSNNGVSLVQSAQIPGYDASVCFIPAFEFTIVTTREADADKVRLTDVNWTDSLDEKEVTATFAHNVTDRNGVLMATVHSTVRGVYSQVNNWSQMLSVTATISGTFAHDFTYSTSFGGNQGYLNLYFQGAYVCTWTYTIATNGRISSYKN